MTKAIKPSNSGVAGMGAPVSWTPKSRLLTTKLSTAFQKDQGMGERRGRKAAEGKMRRRRGWGPAKWPGSPEHHQPCPGRGEEGARHVWKWKDRVYIKRPGQGHRAVVAQSRDANRLLAPQPAALAPSEEPQCKWQRWQERGLPPLQTFPPFVDLSFHSFFPRIIEGAQKFIWKQSSSLL